MSLFGGSGKSLFDQAGAANVASQNTRRRAPGPSTAATPAPPVTNATPGSRARTAAPGATDTGTDARKPTLRSRLTGRQAVARPTLGGEPELPEPSDVGGAANTAAQRARRRGVGANALTGKTSSVNQAAPRLLKKTLLSNG